MELTIKTRAKHGRYARTTRAEVLAEEKRFADLIEDVTRAYWKNRASGLVTAKSAGRTISENGFDAYGYWR